jgi:hypothetical protein
MNHGRFVRAVVIENQVHIQLEPRFEIRTPLHHLIGVDLTQFDAIGPYSALRLLAEIGTDMTRWPTENTSRPG